MIKMIACVDRNGALGYQNQLLYLIKEDLKRFKELTQDNIVVMGRKTYESILEKNGNPLPNRINVVLTTDKKYKDKVNEDIVVYNDIDVLINQVTNNDTDKDVYILGGEQIYKQFLPYVDTIELTVVAHETEQFDAQLDLETIESEFRMIDNLFRHNDEYEYSFRTYERR